MEPITDLVRPIGMDRISEALADYWLDWADRAAVDTSPEFDARVLDAIRRAPVPNSLAQYRDRDDPTFPA